MGVGLNDILSPCNGRSQQEVDVLEQRMTQMDFEYFGTAQHKMGVEAFLARDDALLLDVRSREETETVRLLLKHHCPVLEIPLDEVPARLDEIPRDKTVGVFCSSGVRSVIVFALLQSQGFDKARVLPGGYVALMAALMPGSVYKAAHRR